MYFHQNIKETGSALVVSLIIMAILAALGVACLDSADTNILLSANDRDTKNAFFFADSGINIGEVFLETAIEEGNATFFGDSADTWVNSTVCAFSPNDFPLTANQGAGNQLTYIRSGALGAGPVGGYSIQMGTGYEGIGKSAAHGGTFTTYLIRSHRDGARESVSEIDAAWRHINQ